MKIAVNARWLLPNKLEGTGIYTLRMLEQIIPAFPQHEFHLLLDRGIATDQFSLDFPNVHFHVVAPQARHPLLWTLWNDFSVPRALKKLRYRFVLVTRWTAREKPEYHNGSPFTI